MDFGTLIGIVAGLGLIMGSMALGGSIGAFFNVAGLLIVVGGTAAATLINESVSHVVGALKVALQAFFDRSRPSENMIQQIVDLAAKARKEGLVSLEGEVIEDPFLARGVRLGVDGLSPEVITTTLTSELMALKKRHQRGQQIFKFMASTAPAMGMVGTLIGLVQMLRNMENPDDIGPAMAVALLTTLYGAVLAFLIFGPIASKLEVRSGEESSQKTLAIVGVESILKGDNTLVIQSKLESFLSPAERRALEAARK
jgi:chemotaxis protein MotA